MAKKVKGIRVVAKREGFRRAGRAFGAEPVEIPLEDLNKAELAAIKGDPMLIVTEAEIEIADAK